MIEMIKKYKKPTPWAWRKFGDALLASAALFGGGGLIAFDTLKEIFSDHELKIMIGATIIIGVVGKFLTNFFTEDTNEKT